MKSLIITLMIAVSGLVYVKTTSTPIKPSHTTEHTDRLQTLREYSVSYKTADEDMKYVIKKFVITRYADTDLLDVPDVRLRGFLFEMRGY